MRNRKSLRAMVDAGSVIFTTLLVGFLVGMLVFMFRENPPVLAGVGGIWASAIAAGAALCS